MSHLPLSTLCTYGLPLRAYDQLVLAERPERPRPEEPRRRRHPRRRGLLARVGRPRLVAGAR